MFHEKVCLQNMKKGNTEFSVCHQHGLQLCIFRKKAVYSSI